MVVAKEQRLFEASLVELCLGFSLKDEQKMASYLFQRVPYVLLTSL